MVLFLTRGLSHEGRVLRGQAGGMKVAYLLGRDVWVCGEARNRHVEVWL